MAVNIKKRILRFMFLIKTDVEKYDVYSNK